MTIRLRLTIVYTVILGITLFLFGMALYLVLENRLLNEIDGELQVRGKEVVRQIQVVDRFPYGFGKWIDIPSFDIFASPDLFIQIRNMKGEVLASSSNLGEYSLPLSRQTLEGAKEAHIFLDTIKVNGNQVRMYVLPFSYRGSLIGMVQVAIPLAAVESSLQTLRWVLMLVGLITLLLAAGLGWVMARQALRPVDRIISATEAIHVGKDLNKRIEVTHPQDEMGRLSETINSMLARLQSVYEQLEQSIKIQRRFVSDASHELRTPLTTIRGNVEWLRKVAEDRKEEQEHAEFNEALDDILDETERMSRMVEDLLILARSDAQASVPRQGVIVANWLEDFARKASRLENEAEFSYSLDPVKLEGMRIWGNKEMLDRMLWIFLDNAFKYTPNGQVKLEVDSNSNLLVIRVADTGIGISTEDLPHIFERFYRADPARGRSGTGLGLSIADSIVKEHGGSIQVESEVDRGTIFIIRLPLVDGSNSV